MNDEQLKELFARAKQERAEQAEQAKPEAKQRAIDAAMAEFSAAGCADKKDSKPSQALFAWLRLSRAKSSTEDSFMNRYFLPGIVGGAATVFSLLFIVVLVDFDVSQRPLSNDGEALVADINSPEAEPRLEEELIVTGFRAEPSKQTYAESAAAAPALAEAAPAVAQVPGHEAPGVDSIASKPVSKSMSRSMLLSKQQIAPAAPAANYAQASSDLLPPARQQAFRDQFEHAELSGIKLVKNEPVSTFSIDVDTASYSYVRRTLNEGHLPPADSVRIEEMLNYFDYNYPAPTNAKQPFKASTWLSASPWNKGKKLLHIGIKAYELEGQAQPKSKLVFLLDVSGSMNSPDKLPLVKQSMNLLLSKLHDDDSVAIVVYAGAAGTVLEPTKVKDKQKILSALNRLEAGGSTAGAEGIELAYQLAEAQFDKDAVNRIILATDGDFNVGIRDRETLKNFVERKRAKGIFLSVLGFGRGNYNDHLMQELAQNGNGVAAYIDTLSEAQKVLVEEAHASLFPVANDVKIQLEFNPAQVSEYRLVGYETRALRNEDFNNDKVDAGDIGAGHKVTAIYELTPADSAAQSHEPLRYAKPSKAAAPADGEWAFVKIRYKLPGETQSKLIEQPVTKAQQQVPAELKQEFEFATAVAGFAQLLKDERYVHSWGFDEALELAKANRGEDDFGYRSEFVQLIRKAQVAKAM
ncbi:vWA domain-containing protein [Agaribacterium haliotis]|uniref:vWA domain-containing protein n=1 Tax=Agaribacterium haliotis TaxID=2013869 RepID=UPI000BB583B6|nr:VWA domain-containing protein [Agaribacterium haliotis]